MEKQIIKQILNEIQAIKNECNEFCNFTDYINKEQSSLNFIDEYIKDKALKKIVGKLFTDGHHARAVEEAYKFIDNLVKKRITPACANSSGSPLMTTVFSEKKPILKLNAGISVSERDEQLGYMQIFSGCMTGIRNPRAHDCDWEDSEWHAMQLLVFADHLVERIRLAEKQQYT